MKKSLRGIKIADYIHFLKHLYPFIKKELRIAHVNKSPREFIRKSMVNTLINAFLFTGLSFFVLDKANLSFFLMVPIFFLFLFLFFNFNLVKLKAAIKKREREINKEVLFIGRYLLIKLYSGRPLLNAMIETAKAKGIKTRSISEIVDEVNMGTSVERALDNALNYAPSDKFKRILFHVNNALKLGIDVTGPLEGVINEIAIEQENEIKRYGKKVNTLVIFYMLVAIVVPSIGMVMFIILSGFLNILIGLREFAIVIFFIAVIQLFFISLFKSIRPMVNL